MMATPTTNPAPAHHSHSGTGTGAGGPNSPQQSRRSSAARGVSSPWIQVVRTGESESTVAVTSSSPPVSPPASCEQVVHSSDCSPPDEVVIAGNASSLSPEDAAIDTQLESDTNSNGAKKPAWNKPSNGAADVSPVMGAVSWPALSDSTKASPKLPSSDSLKSLSDGSVSVTEGTGMASASHRQANTNNVNPNTMLNHVVPSRQRSMKRGGGNSNHNASANGGFSQQQAQGFEVETVLNNSTKSGNSGAESSSRDNNNYRNGGQWGGFGSQSHGGNDYQHQRNANRRGNVGPHPRGDGTYYNGYGGRRDQDRRNPDWKPHRSWGNRDAHMQPQRGPARPFMVGPPHTSPPFIPTPMPVQPYRPPMVYSEVPPLFYFPGPFPDSLRMPMLSPVPPVYVHVPDTQLHTRIVNQIDYYFSNENLIKDTFLRQNMDEQGWVPVTLIAGFKKVMELTDNIQLILNVVRSSTVVEVQGEKLRRRNDWFHWLIPPSVQNSTMSSPRSPQMSGPDLLAENLQRVVFDYNTTGHGNAEAHLSRSSSTELSTPFTQFGTEMAEQADAQNSQPMPLGNPS
ncbi:la-related protein 1C-like isoform X1 [Solanum stenotomum]|uniref:la-related protein 1C-like isoform X1 n=1 Tax=Solanum stenotomum TaxID=172797 RepID=UPI0020CFE9F3|nr:la-related protein 1C-like isoform X1 [Solanum stenotomum]